MSTTFPISTGPVAYRRASSRREQLLPRAPALWMGAVLVLGALFPVTSELLGFTFAGQVYVGELLMALIAVGSAIMSFRERRYWDSTLRLAVITLVVSLIAYMIADLVNRTELSNLMRGWARMIFLITDVIGLNAICRKHPSRIFAFIVGLSIGFLLTAERLSFESAYYKLYVALPLLMLVLALVPLIPVRQRYMLTAVTWLGLGVLDIYLDYRSLSGICLLGGSIMLAKVLTRVRFRSLYGVGLGMAVMLASGAVVYSLAATAENYGDRRSASNSERVALATAAVYGIRQSPIVGSGSWANSSETDNVIRGTFSESAGRRFGRPDTHPGHSEFLQVWYEAGILGPAFFVFLLIASVKTLRQYIGREPLHPLYALTLFFMIFSVYNFFVSPFGGLARFFLAIAVTLILIHRRMRAPARMRAYAVS